MLMTVYKILFIYFYVLLGQGYAEIPVCYEAMFISHGFLASPFETEKIGQYFNKIRKSTTPAVTKKYAYIFEVSPTYQ